MKKILLLFSIIIFLFSCENAPSEKPPKAEDTPLREDTLKPTTSATGALTEKLHTITIATTSLDSMKMFFVDGMGLTMEEQAVADSTKMIQRQLWDIPEDIDWETYLIHRPAVPELIRIRLMVLNKETPSIHKSWSSRELGPFSIGFPNAKQSALDKELREKGFDSMEAMQEGTIPHPDGGTYRYKETIYKAPEFIHAVGIERMDRMPQLAPVDESNGEGGPGYSAMVLEDSDTFLAFLTEVLGLELRSDRHWKSSEGSALGIEAGVPFRFSLVYAHGSTHNHLLFLDYEDDQFIPIDVAPKIPNQGLGMWTFPTKDLQEVKKRAEANGIKILQEPIKYVDPLLGEKEVMTLLAPNGFLIELFGSQSR